MRRPLLGALALTLATALPVAAQSQERGYISLSGGVQGATGTFSDRFTYTVNAEEATTEVRYPSKTGILFDGGAGIRFWKSIGAAVHLSRSSVSGTAQTESQIPHPFFDDRDREVSGDAGDITRTETAAHVQLYYRRASGRWRLRVFAGPSYFTVEQEVVTGVTVGEEFPFDSATFRRATTKRGKGSAPGFNAGADVSWMFTPHVGAGALIRFARANVDFNVDGTHRVSSHAGGAQAAAGIRISF